MPAPGQTSPPCWPAEGPNADIAQLVWRAKYRAEGEAGVSDSWRRIALAMAAPEADADLWARRFYALLEDFRFLPAGRIQAGAGIAGRSMLNCFVTASPTDEVAGAMTALEEAVRTLSAGGGVGCDFSLLSPRGTPLPGGGAPGPVAMLQLWDAACGAFLGGSARSGAMMGTLRCDHPDIEAFIGAKQTPGALSRFNLSVQVTDAFIAAARADRAWPLTDGRGDVRKLVSARALWRRIAEAAYDGGEPGVLFVDRINRDNPLWWRERITATNPCGEVPLPPHGACVLGSINLTRFVRGPFTPQASLDLAAIAQTSALAVRFLDNILEVTDFPQPVQAQTARESRRIGLGVTGLADALVMLGITYGTPASLTLTAELFRTMRDAACRASIDLARDKGPFPAFEAEPYLAGDYVSRLPQALRADIAAHGVRNSHRLAVAPTGSISLLAGGVSTGLEPIFAAVQARAIRGADGALEQVTLIDPALALWRARSGSETPPAGFVAADALPLEAHLAIPAAAQPFIDSAVSKTVNAPQAWPLESFALVFDRAFDLGLKGCAAFRPSPVRAGLLQACAASLVACD